METKLGGDGVGRGKKGKKKTDRDRHCVRASWGAAVLRPYMSCDSSRRGRDSVGRLGSGRRGWSFSAALETGYIFPDAGLGSRRTGIGEAACLDGFPRGPGGRMGAR